MKYNTDDYWELHRILNTWEKDSVIDYILDDISEEDAKELIKQHKEG